MGIVVGKEKVEVVRHDFYKVTDECLVQLLEQVASGHLQIVKVQAGPLEVLSISVVRKLPFQGSVVVKIQPQIDFVVGKENSEEKPCKSCGSTGICDCPIDLERE